MNWHEEPISGGFGYVSPVDAPVGARTAPYSPKLSLDQVAKFLGVEAYPKGMAWRCLNGHEYAEDFEPDRCPVDDLPLSRPMLTIDLSRE